MIDRILHFIPKSILIVAIAYFVGVVGMDIVQIVSLGGRVKTAREQAEKLKAQVDKHKDQARFAPPARDSNQIVGKALSAWTRVPAGESFSAYDFYPR